MRRLNACIRGDLLLQVKYGFYAVYAILTVLYILLLKRLPDQVLDMAVPLIIFTDPSLLGFYFIGALILLEKGENTLECLIATPLRIWEYLVSKMISLTMLALLAGTIIAIFSKGKEVNYFLLFGGILLTSFLFILIGFMAVAKFRTVNEYMMTSVLYMMVLCLPLLDFFGIVQSPFFYLLPTQASLLLIRGAFQPVGIWNILYAIVFLAVSISVAYKLAYRAFYRFIILKEGDR